MENPTRHDAKNWHPKDRIFRGLPLQTFQPDIAERSFGEPQGTSPIIGFRIFWSNNEKPIQKSK